MDYGWNKEISKILMTIFLPKKNSTKINNLNCLNIKNCN